MRVLFIVHDNYQEDNELPLGVLNLATILKNNEVDVSIYCMDVYHYTNKQLADYLDKNEFDIIGLGFMAARFNETIIPLCKVINRHKKNAWLMLGGHGPSPIAEYMLDKVKADCVVVGECEANIMDILDHRQNNDNKRIFYGKRFNKLDKIPEPDWELLPIEKYAYSMRVDNMKPGDGFLSIESSRGCVNRCAFCYRMEKGVRLKSIDSIVNQIKHLRNKYNVKYVLFTDELFILSKKRLEQYYCAMRDAGIDDIDYWCNARVDLIDDELMDLMKKSGCRFINYGFESMDADVLEAMHKNTTPEQNDTAARITKEYNIPFGINIIWNNIYDTFESLEMGKEFIMKYNLFGQLRTIRPVTPYPGCDLYYYALRRGLLDGPEDFFNRFKNSDLITVNFTYMNVKDMYDALYKTNRELIFHHYKNTTGDMKEAEYMAHQFYRVYYEKFYKFRGARHYEAEE